MSAGQNRRRAQILALYQSGELLRLARLHGTMAKIGAACGMTGEALRGCWRALVAGGEVPPWIDFVGDGLTSPVLTSPAQDNSPAHEKWPNVAAFDAEPPFEPVPDGFRVKSLSTHVDENGETQQQWIDSAVGTTVESFESARPAGHFVKGVSTLVGADGTVRGQWIKTANTNEIDPAEVLRRAFGDEMPKAEPITAPTHTADDLLATYLIGDGHLGLHAWRQDSGGDWDLSIAERTLFGAADRLVALSPAASRGLIVNIGDFFHADSNAATTTKGTRVDVDTRWSKVLAVGIRLMRRMIERALEKHDEVTVINEIGNHDTHTSVVLAMCLAQFYEREPRVVIDTSPQHFHYYRFGKVLIGTHHGHMVKVDKLPGVMATDRAVDWGETLYRHWDTGHVHHVTFHEFPGCTVRTLGVMAPGDAWHTASGYRSGREMISTIYHREFGPLTTNRVGYHQLAA